MMYQSGSNLKSLERKQAVETGLYGSQVAMQNHLASFGGLYEVEDVDFEHLNGPQSALARVDTEDIADCGAIEDFELTQADLWRMKHMDECQKEMFPHNTGRQVYFKKLDALRRRVLGAYTVEQLYALSDECDEMDLFMLNRVEDWKTVKTTFDRLEAQFSKVEKRLKASAAERTHLIEVGTIRPREVAIAV